MGIDLDALTARARAAEPDRTDPVQVTIANELVEFVFERVLARRMCGQCGLDYNLIHHRPAERDKCDVCGEEQDDAGQEAPPGGHHGPGDRHGETRRQVRRTGTHEQRLRRRAAHHEAGGKKKIRPKCPHRHGVRRRLPDG